MLSAVARRGAQVARLAAASSHSSAAAAVSTSSSSSIRLTYVAAVPVRQFTRCAASYKTPEIIEKLAENDGGIPVDLAAGDEAAEMKIAYGGSGGLLPPAGYGTKDKPIEVPSSHHERVVGFEDPETHAVLWFRLQKGKLQWVHRIDKYFKLVDSGVPSSAHH